MRITLLLPNNYMETLKPMFEACNRGEGAIFAQPYDSGEIVFRLVTLAQADGIISITGGPPNTGVQLTASPQANESAKDLSGLRA